MYSSRRTNQGGSVAIFLIVAALLSAAVIGGTYAIQKRGAHVRTNEPIAKQTDQSKQTSDDQTKNQQSDAEKQKAEAEAAAKQAEAKKAQEQKAAADKKAADQKQAEVAKQAAAAEAEKKRQQQAVIPQTNTAPAANSLPQTGPTDAVPEFIGGAILIGALIAYLKSYRHRFGSLLR